MYQDSQGQPGNKTDLQLINFIIFGALGFTALLVLTICGLFVLCRSSSRSNEGRRRSNNSIVREQSPSIVNGEHPIAFMLPTVSLSETGSETDPTPSDLESLGYQSRSPSSTSLSLASLTGSNIYSSPLLSPSIYPSPLLPSSNYPSPLLPSPHQSLPRTGGSVRQREKSSRSISLSPRPSSLGGLPTSFLSLPSSHLSSLQPRPLRMQGSRDQFARSSPLPMYRPEDVDSEAPLALGRLHLRLTYRANKDELQVKILRGEELATNYKTGTASTSVKLTLLPTKLPKYCTGLVEDSLNPEYNEEFSFPLAKEQVKGKVLKLTLFDHDRSSKKVIGSGLVSLFHVGILADRDLEVKETCVDLKETVDSEITELLADRLQLSLKYEPTPGRLSLGVSTAWVQSLPLEDNDTDLYAKVTLFEGRRVIKAKKTKLLLISEEVCFDEKFSILLPLNFLDGVSCVISLCSRSRLGVKQVLGRTSVGPYSFCNGPGLHQWQRMVSCPGEEIMLVHAMI